MRQWFCRLTAVFLYFFFVINVAGMSAAEAALISTKQEIEIGHDVGQRLEKKYGLVDDPALQERVDRIGKSLVAVCDRKNLPYSFKVLNSKEINALAAPGGYIYVFKGLIDLMPSDDELAGVIGHELAHVVKRHSVRQIEKSMGMSILFGAAFGDRGAILQNLAFNAIMAGYSRSDEREADKLGFTYSFNAGYNPYSMMMGLQKLSELDQKYHYDLFSDHPEGKARVALVQSYMNKAKIRPQTAAVENGAQIVDGAWKLPVLTATYNGYKPIYRANFAAGKLYRAHQRSDYSPDNYIVDSDGTNSTIYYEDTALLTLTPEDAASHGVSTMDLASLYIRKLKEWQKT